MYEEAAILVSVRQFSLELILKVKVVLSNKEIMYLKLKHLKWFWLACLWSERREKLQKGLIIQFAD